MKHSCQELDEEEQELACLLSVFALAPIPWQFVEQSLPEQDRDRTRASRHPDS